ncbi:hypothetical protein FA15DRAFT_668153 [Coprinopsis marcescibilis]|uniref:Uncharacterized protein n=1 Tax=Coprinopsis marcescibilis TaxID=230819 RepID=A0A5C3L174_COPMA|nr:hypothetical protein FA15DRAFT_668153 [Coprinopsis marcescibilis]
MPFASWQNALRSAGRKAANSLRSNHSNGGSLEGSGTTGTRALHSGAAVRTAHPATHADIIHKFTTTLDQIRPRNPAHRLFSSTNGLLANIFTKLAAPGYRAPLGSYPRTATNAGRNLLQARHMTIQSGLSLPARFAIRNNNLRSTGAGSFLPRAPSVPIRGPIASQMGLGTARNFSSARPLFQNLVENVPIALRALYEADLDELRPGIKSNAPRRIPVPYKKGSRSANASKLKARTTKRSPAVAKVTAADSTEMERYFSAPAPPAVTTQLLIPLAPTPTNRVPLSALDDYLQDLPSSDYPTPLGPPASNGRFLPLRDIGEMHGSYSSHTLRVSTIFARLDQANVWSRGVVCSAYSGPGAGAIGRRESVVDDPKSGSDGVCTILKVEFHGWTAAEVRGVIGESGSGWCALEEMWHGENEDDKGMLSDTEDDGDSLSSMSGLSSPAFFTSPPSLPIEAMFDTGLPFIDPAQSFVLPTLDFSSTFLSSSSERSEPRATTTRTLVLDYEDPWMDVEDEGSLSDGYMSAGSMSPISLSRSSSTSSFEDMALGVKRPLSETPVSEAGWSRLGFSSRFHDAASTRDASEPQEMMF